MKKINYYLALCLLFFISVDVYAGNTRVIGYFPSYRATTDVSAQCAKMTDIIFSFINPKTSGVLEQGNASDDVWGFDLNKFIIVRDAAATKGTNLWIALGGADQGDQRASRLSTVSGNSGTRTALVNDLVAFAITHSCYGISVDWEFPKDGTAKANHLLLMQALKAKIAASTNPNIKVAVAVGGETNGQVNHTQYLDASLFSSNAALVDEWHIMAYDFPSSYDANSHSTVANTTASLDGWNAKGVPYNKMVVGVPFYGVDAARSNNKPGYRDILPKGNATYTGDYAGGVYYNGINTLKTKIDLAVNKQTMGILIWDLGQDFAPSDAVSLLGGMDTYLATLCPVPKPNLGPDKGVCGANPITLDPGIPVASGRVFTWYKDNVLINGQSGITLSVTAAGTYRVNIAQSGCYKEDEIVVVAGSPFITAGANGCSGTTLQLSVTNPTNGKTYDWYDQAVSGTKKGSGTTYSQVFNSTTTLYVEEKAAGVVTYTSSTAVVQANYAWNGVPTTGVYARADFLTVLTDLTIKSVRVFANGPSGATFTIKVLKASDNTLVAESSSNVIAADGTKQSWEYTLKDVNIGITLTPGEYFVTANVTAGSLAMKFDPAASTATTEAGVYSLGVHCHTNFGNGFLKSETTDVNSYKNAGQLYNYVIETGANASCGRTAATATVVTCGPPSVTITAPTANQNFAFDGSAITLTATVTDETSVSSVSFEIWDGASKIATLTPSANGSVYSSTWTATTWALSKQYTLKVIATDNSANTTNQTVNFTVASGVGVTEVVSATEVSVYPNPSSDNINVNVEVVKGGTASITVYDLAGRTVYTSNSTLIAGKNTSVIPVNTLNAGTYLLKVSVDGQSVNRSFSVVK